MSSLEPGVSCEPLAVGDPISKGQVEYDLPSKANAPPIALQVPHPALQGEPWHWNMDATFHVLLVDDDAVTVKALGQLLKSFNYKVTTATNGKDAIQLLEANRASNGPPIDLVLTDILMPEVNGFDLMHEVMHGTMLSEIPVVVMSGMDSQESVLKAFEAGAADYLIKPLRRNEVATLWQHVWRANRYKAAVHGPPAQGGSGCDNHHNNHNNHDSCVGAQQATGVGASGIAAAAAKAEPGFRQLLSGSNHATTATKNGGSSGASTSMAEQSTMGTVAGHALAIQAAKHLAANGALHSNTTNATSTHGTGQSNAPSHTVYHGAGMGSSHTGQTSALRPVGAGKWSTHMACQAADGGGPMDAEEGAGTAAQARLLASHTSRLAISTADTCTDAGTSTSLEEGEDGEGRATSPMTLAPAQAQAQGQEQPQQNGHHKESSASPPAAMASAPSAPSAMQMDNGSIFSAAGHAQPRGPAGKVSQSVITLPSGTLSAAMPDAAGSLPQHVFAVKMEGGTQQMPRPVPAWGVALGCSNAANGEGTPGASAPKALTEQQEHRDGREPGPHGVGALNVKGQDQHMEDGARPVAAPAPPAAADAEEQRRRKQAEEDAETAEAAGLLLGVAAAAAAEQAAARRAVQQHQHVPGHGRGARHSNSHKPGNHHVHSHGHGTHHSHHGSNDPAGLHHTTHNQLKQSARSAFSALTVILPRKGGSSKSGGASTPPSSGGDPRSSMSPTPGVSEPSNLLPYPPPLDINGTGAQQDHPDLSSSKMETSSGQTTGAAAPAAEGGSASPPSSAKAHAGVDMAMGAEARQQGTGEDGEVEVDAGGTVTGVPAGGGPLPMFFTGQQHPQAHPGLMLPQAVMPLLAYSFQAAGLPPEMAAQMYMGPPHNDGRAGPSYMDCMASFGNGAAAAGMPHPYPSVVLVAGRTEAQGAAAAHRRAAVQKYLMKKKNRNFKKKVRYESRKRLAEARPRVRGQFVKQETLAALASVPASDGSKAEAAGGSPAEAQPTERQTSIGASTSSGGPMSHKTQLQGTARTRARAQQQQQRVSPAGGMRGKRQRMQWARRVDGEEQDDADEEEAVSGEGDEEVEAEELQVCA